LCCILLGADSLVFHVGYEFANGAKEMSLKSDQRGWCPILFSPVHMSVYDIPAHLLYKHDEGEPRGFIRNM